MLFDIAPSEILLIVVVAVVVIGPKDMPRALRVAGRWIGKMRRVSGHFRSGLETMIREAEMADMEEKWRAQNAAVLEAHPLAADAEAGAGAPVMLEHQPAPIIAAPSHISDPLAPPP